MRNNVEITSKKHILIGNDICLIATVMIFIENIHDIVMYELPGLNTCRVNILGLKKQISKIYFSSHYFPSS